MQSLGERGCPSGNFDPFSAILHGRCLTMDRYARKERQTSLRMNTRASPIFSGNCKGTTTSSQEGLRLRHNPIETHTPARRSLILHNTSAAGLPLPRSLRAPSLRPGPNRSRAAANASFTKALLPITAPSEKYLTRYRSIAAKNKKRGFLFEFGFLFG